MTNEAEIQTKKPRHNWKIAAAVVIVLVALSASSLVAWHITRPKKPIPANLLKGLSFQVYYPYHLPPGYAVNPDSFSRKGNVLIFAIKNTNTGKSIAVTEEAKPSDINLDQQSPVPLPTDKTFFTPVGHATISQWGTNTVSSLVTDQTWVILNVSGIAPAQAQSVTSSFIKL